MSAVNITEPADGTVLDYNQKKIRIRWESDSQWTINAWKIYLGSEDGRWDLLMCELDALKHIDLDPEELPLGGRLFAQVRGVYKGKGKDKEGKEVEMDERVFSETVRWICPEPKSLV